VSATAQIPAEGATVIVDTGHTKVVGRSQGIMPGRKRGSWFDRQPKLILTNGSTCAHIPLDEIKGIATL
jgi:hypothetical protein